MTTELMNFEGHNVEIIEVNGQILFNSNHVGICLDFADSTIRDHMSKMSDKHVIKLTNSDVGLTNIRILNNAGENFLTESGVYNLIFKSRKPEAEKFQNWITDEVLPSIRKTGSYSLMPKSFPEALRLYANELEMKELVIKQRDEAIRTKAQIGSKREATAMAHTAIFKKENEKLKTQIGNSERYKQVTAILWLKEFFDIHMHIKVIYNVVGKQLSKLSTDLEIASIDVESIKYNTVKAYDINVINYFKQQLMEDKDKTIMTKYRLN
jgi:prophage antirepressor-like protein